MTQSDYKSAGVDIEAGNESVNRIKNIVKDTFDQNVLTGLGSFGSLYGLGEVLKNYRDPVLVQSCDSVGTKIMVATMVGRHKGIGLDMVGHSCGDIVAQGARPLTFLDYIAANKISPDHVEELVSGMAEGCKSVGMSLVGGEVAELPGVYQPNEYDLVGTVTGVVEKEKMITGKNIKLGDVVLGFASNGLHTNGYSLARKLFFEVGGYKIDSNIPELEKNVGDTLLEPHTNYTNPILGIIDAGIEIKGLAHITGGGFVNNIPRILPPDCAVEINKGSWPVLPVFTVMQRLGKVEEVEMYRTFNMGIGMVMVVSAEAAAKAIEKIKDYPEFKLFEIGRVVEGAQKVELK